MSRLILLAAGGTGGHIFPAEATARALLARGHEVALVTDKRGGSFAELPQVPVHRIAASSPGGGVAKLAQAALLLGRGTMEAMALVARLKPAAVIAFGGYPAVPTGLAAIRGRVPLLVHEQNAVLGRANRLLARRARLVATAFPAVAKLPVHASMLETGNPVRAGIMALAQGGYTPPSGPASGGPVRLLVLGGSQGARVLSQVVPAALARLPETLRRRLIVAHQARAEDLDQAQAAYASAGIKAELAPFFADVPARLATAHLLVCRAGASTMAELTVAGRPAVLVPYPHATDDHQTANAKAFAGAGAGWAMAQPDFTAEALARHLEALLAQPALLARAAAAALSLGRPDAAQRLAEAAIQLAEGASLRTSQPTSHAVRSFA